MLRIEDVTLSIGGHELLTGATLHVRPGNRVGLIGPNGAGKSTLLRAVLGEIDIDAGKITMRSDANPGWLPQQAVSGSTATVWIEAASRMTRHQALKAELESAQAAVEAGRADATERLAIATEAFKLAGGFSVDERIGEVLHGLGFAPEDWHRTCDTFSGGWQMRIALARLLLSEPGLLLLDEPTNHLDLHARSWLSTFLARYPHALLIVSHDRHLLDKVCTHIAEVRQGGLQVFTGNLSAWLAERARRDELAAVTYERQQGEIERLERFVERFGAKATKASQAQSRQKVLDKMERVDAPQRDKKPRFTLPEAPPCSHEALVLRKLSAGWPEGPDLLNGLDFTLARGMRVAVLGPNGAGKSTLLHVLSGRLLPRSGRRVVGKDVRIGIFNQDLAQELPADQSGLEVVAAAAPTVQESRLRAVLGALGLTGPAALRPIGALSGGEKARVALSALALRPCNVLLLDEPTNHLDAVTVEVLSEALADWGGALLLVSHDRWMVERVATHVLHVRAEGITLKAGVEASDFEPVGPAKRERSHDSTAEDDHEARKRRQRERERAKRRAERIGAEIEAAEAEAKRAEEAMFEAATDPKKMRTLVSAQQAADAKVAALYAEWEALEGLLAEG